MFTALNEVQNCKLASRQFITDRDDRAATCQDGL
jgi:hypothetical protein